MTSSANRRLRKMQGKTVQVNDSSFNKMLPRIGEASKTVGNLAEQIREVNEKLGSLGELVNLVHTMHEGLKGLERELACQRYVSLRMFQNSTSAPLGDPLLEPFEELERKFRAEFETLNPVVL